ncbi:RING-H2 finger protein ATL80-like [Phragmites australis]|uniref:RING-H2 finger protein ATL80-like n=1 Tax=Phragmites australis TaxID=29695 RepID=UPI002D784189|nr:RING-H2 finger protein ATL80-like [Phragmites australis]
MRACGGCAPQEYCHARCLLTAGGPPPASASASAPSLDAQRAHLERALGATTTVLFVASVSYIALSTLYGCLCTGRPRKSGSDSGASPAAAAAAYETKRALEEIPVVLVQLRDPDGDRNNWEGGAEQEDEGGECAVCLAEYAGGDEVRMLPSCRHGFHRECVDAKVCRTPVAARSEVHDAKVCAGGDAVLPLPVNP